MLSTVEEAVKVVGRHVRGHFAVALDGTNEKTINREEKALGTYPSKYITSRPMRAPHYLG